MDAMILAAGLGTRLRPLTDTRPKALVELDGVPMLELVARRLIAAGATRLVVNVHHHAEQVRTFLRKRNDFGVEVCISDETDTLLDTGGGLLHAHGCFRGDTPFLLHNVDVLSAIDIRALYAAHNTNNALATLAVMERESSRYLLFDEAGLCGFGNRGTGFRELAREPMGTTQELGFCGIHAISQNIFGMITERGVFSIIPLYMRLARAGERILPFRADNAEWFDTGSHEKLEQAGRAYKALAHLHQ